jgi:DNA-binding transcriptional regulator YdaS (Cro superfamily)
MARELAGQILQGSPNAVAATKGLLQALESGESNLDQWEARRREILSSPERAAAIARAKKSS